MLSYENRPAMAQPTPPTADHISMPASSNNALTNGTRSNNTSQPKTEHSHIWLITGPAGCGKSTVAQFLAKSMNLPFIEGDEFHPQSNVDKMSKGIPLTDADRWDWLTRLREEAVNQISSGSQGVVLTCSALKRKYRDVIRVAGFYSQGARVHFVYLHAPEEVLAARVGARAGHFMGANMVHSQFSILEAPGEKETDVISVDVSGSIEQVEEEALAKIQEAVRSELVKDS
ncbi:P-loop containing nucleoside triphosphate hydrolase protein [Cadophora sp. MPI-SDFR-AT-0126]|nr:P-loop containing nucleoside triphosphate hydrolase protein [Leotiomycetes sp. MPI-SDFR-AT-0126]